MVIIWAINSGERLRTLEGHTDRVRSVRFSNDGRLVASASDDTTVIIWDATTGEFRHSLEHRYPVHLVAFSPNGRLVASVPKDETFIIWSTVTGHLNHSLNHEGLVNCAAFSPDGLLVASASDDKTVIIWDTTTGQRRHTLEHGQRAQLVTFSLDGKLVASATSDRTVVIWDADAGSCRQLVKVGKLISNLTFRDGNRQISTDVGAFAIRDVSESPPPESSDAKYVGYGFKDGGIMLDDQDVLLFPHQYQPMSFAVSGSTMATSTANDDVLIMRFDLHRAATV
ncbi:hypothetical protein LQW54_002191 [Pestalotiopsis sp. IQ-011]